MKKILLVSLTLSLLVGIIFAQEMIPTPDNKKAMKPLSLKIIPSERTAPGIYFYQNSAFSFNFLL